MLFERFQWYMLTVSQKRRQDAPISSGRRQNGEARLQTRTTRDARAHIHTRETRSCADPLAQIAKAVMPTVVAAKGRCVASTPSLELAHSAVRNP